MPETKNVKKDKPLPKEESESRTERDDAWMCGPWSRRRWPDGMPRHYRRFRRRSILGPLMLLFLGIILLLNSTGVIGWTVWAFLWRFWPVFLIFGGLRLIIGDSWISELVVSIFAILAFLFVGVTVYEVYNNSQLNFVSGPFRNMVEDFKGKYVWDDLGEYTTTESEIEKEDYDDVEKRSLTLDIGGTRFELNDSDDESYFAVDSNHYKSWGVPVVEQEMDEETLEIVFKQDYENPRAFLANRVPIHYLTLGSPEIETDINIDLGAGKGDLTFSELNITDLTAEVGAGELIIDLTEESIPTGKMILEIGAGSITINIPESVGYVMDYDLGIGSIEHDSTDIGTFIGSDSEYKSENYDEAEIVFELEVGVGIGSLKIKTK